MTTITKSSLFALGSTLLLLGLTGCGGGTESPGPEIEDVIGDNPSGGGPSPGSPEDTDQSDEEFTVLVAPEDTRWEFNEREEFYEGGVLVACARNTLDESGRLLSSALSFDDGEEFTVFNCDDNDSFIDTITYQYFENDTRVVATARSSYNPDAICLSSEYNAYKKLVKQDIYQSSRQDFFCDPATGTQITSTVLDYYEDYFLAKMTSYVTPGDDMNWNTIEDNSALLIALVTHNEDRTQNTMDTFLIDLNSGQRTIVERIQTNYQSSMAFNISEVITLSTERDEFVSDIPQGTILSYTQFNYSEENDLLGQSIYSDAGPDANWTATEDNVLSARILYRQ